MLNTTNQSLKDWFFYCPRRSCFRYAAARKYIPQKYRQILFPILQKKLLVAHFLFHESLNDFLPARKKNNWLLHTFQRNQSVKDAIEAIGVPHPEVDVILVQQQGVNYQYQLKDNDRIEVFPVQPDGAFPDNFSLLKKYLHLDRFVLDVHLGKLAKALRLLGFDTVLDYNLSDQMIARLSATENRIALTRDIGLLKHKAIDCGYWLRSQQWEEQLNEVTLRFGLKNKFRPFSRCLMCNGAIAPVSKKEIEHRLPPVSRKLFDEFYQCSQCGRVYWKGSHYERMEEWVRRTSN